MHPKAFVRVPQALNFIFATATIVVAMFEFFSLPPFFDLLDDQSLLNYTAFENDPRADKEEIRRFMDAPILANALASTANIKNPISCFYISFIFSCVSGYGFVG
eukprot:m.60112 g.60112  ORF g.60112 m.60112 type:complete len:104 (+) comp34917_c0_seq1:44-355(+)